MSGAELDPVLVGLEDSCLSDFAMSPEVQRYAVMTVSGQMDRVSFSEYKRACNGNSFFSFQEIKVRAEQLAMKRIKAASDPVVRQFIISSYHQYAEARLTLHPLYPQLTKYLEDRYEIMPDQVGSFLESIVETTSEIDAG